MSSTTSTLRTEGEMYDPMSAPCRPLYRAPAGEGRCGRLPIDQAGIDNRFATRNWTLSPHASRTRIMETG